MSNYPDNMGDDSHLDSDETGEKLSCGCFEECCVCLKCMNCYEILDDDAKECSKCNTWFCYQCANGYTDKDFTCGEYDGEDENTCSECGVE